MLLLAVVAVVLPWIVPERARSVLSGAAGAIAGLAGIFAGAIVLAGGTGTLQFQSALPFGPFVFTPDPLGAIFMIITGAVAMLAALYGIGYVHGPSASSVAWSTLAIFVLGMQMVAAAANSVSFLFGWEVMALASTALVLTEHAQRVAVRSAALWYAVMTQLSFLLVLAGFAVLSAASSTSNLTFGALNIASSSKTGGLAFVLLALGFACKAGLVPLHVWLPRAHPQAPSHVSALMSAAMVNLGLYGILLIIVRLFPSAPLWWGILLLVLGALSSVYGILQASIETDLKRLLAYSTTENLGLMFAAAGTSVVLNATGLTDAAGAALIACLALLISHAAFKTALFLGAGSVLHAVGDVGLNRLGGLGRQMRWTAGAFGIGALGAAALPVSAGFVAEWLLLQSLLHGANSANPFVAIAMPVTVGILALATGLALMTFVKAFGIAFLGNPRSPDAADATESAWSMRVAMSVAAGAVLVIGVVPGLILPGLAGIVGVRGVAGISLGGIAIPDLGVMLDPAALAILAVGVMVPVVAINVLARRRAPSHRTADVWACGSVQPTPRMQYTATSFAEPIVRIFDNTLQPVTDFTITYAPDAPQIVTSASYHQRVTDVLDLRVYAPLVRLVDRFGDIARRLQNGSIHRYLLFSFAALLIVLVAVAL